MQRLLRGWEWAVGIGCVGFDLFAEAQQQGLGVGHSVSAGMGRVVGDGAMDGLGWFTGEGLLFGRSVDQNCIEHGRWRVCVATLSHGAGLMEGVEAEWP